MILTSIFYNYEILFLYQMNFVEEQMVLNVVKVYYFSSLLQLI